MPSVTVKLKNPLSGKNIPPNGVVGWRRLGPLMRAGSENLTLQVSVEGGHVQTIEGGVHIKLPNMESEMRRIDVCHGGAPAERWVMCSRAFVEDPPGTITYVE